MRSRLNSKKLQNSICMATIKAGNRNHTMICAYAPTLPNSEKNPEQREIFYKDLESVINNVSKRSILYVAGDFNAKTGSGYKNYPRQVGFYGTGTINSNGENLLELASRQNLVLTNTMFNHNKAHRTT